MIRPGEVSAAGGPAELPGGLIRAHTVTPRRVEWLWWPYVPLGKISACAGQMGQAKTLFTEWLAANVTRAPRLNLDKAASVLMMCAEDDAEDTTVPRLIAAGADLSRIAFPPDTALSADKLSNFCDEMGDVRLITIDPFAAYIPGNFDSYKSQDVRRVLNPIGDLARERRLAVLLIQHLNRRADTLDALARIADSQGIPAVARSVLIWGPDPSDPDGDQGTAKVLTRPKNNLARGGASAGFRIQTKEVQDAGSQPLLVHTGASDALASDVVADQDARSRTQEAVLWLRDYLAGGPRETEQGGRDALEAGISTKCLRSARERVARSYRPGGNHGPYVWELKGGQPPETGQPRNTALLEEEGIHGQSGAITGNHDAVNARMPVIAHSGEDDATVEHDRLAAKFPETVDLHDGALERLRASVEGQGDQPC